MSVLELVPVSVLELDICVLVLLSVVVDDVGSTLMRLALRSQENGTSIFFR